MKRGLEIREKALVPEHQDIASSTGGLARLYVTMGRYAEAEQLLTRSMKIREKVLGASHPRYAGTLSTLAELYEAMGRFRDGETLYLKALDITEKTRGRNHPATARVMTSLASLYLSTGRYEDGEKLAREAITINEQKLGPEHVETARSMQVLARIYTAKGSYAEAEPLCKRVLGIREKVLSRDHPAVAESRNDLAAIYLASGRVAEAEEEYRKALAIQEKALGPDHLAVAETQNLLGTCLRAKGDLKAAEACYKRALEVREKAFGRDHPDVAESLDTLGGLLAATGRYQEAEDRFKTALAIREKIYGPERPAAAESDHNLGVLYRATGRYDASAHYLQKAYAIRVKTLGERHPLVASTARGLALLYAARGQDGESHRFFEKAVSIEGAKRENVFLLLSEREKLNYMKETESFFHQFVSHTARCPNLGDDAVRSTFDAWLQWKGAVMEAQGAHLRAAAASGSPKMRELFEELTETRREIAKLQASQWMTSDFEEAGKRLRALEQRKDGLEAELSSLSGEFAIVKKAGKADTARIAALLPRDSIYLDFAKVTMSDFRKGTVEGSRYLVFIVRSGAKPVVQLKDLGPAETVDLHVRAFLKTMNSARMGYVPDRKKLDKEGMALDGLLLKPLDAHLAGVGNLYLSPDGDLNLLPFEVLLGPDGVYGVERFRISYIAAGRDIVRLEAREGPSEKGRTALILADPDYDLGLTREERAAEEGKEGPSSPGTAGLGAFSRLPDTKKEADTIGEILAGRMRMPVTGYQDDKAVESVLLAARSPGVVHLATHGYFIGKDELPGKGAGSDGKVTTLRESPMFRSGLALAGINRSLREGKDEGMMSADKVMGLRLLGTDLVALSACETGVGDVESGEGVFGLKRAFVLSGARSVILSLWSVPSSETMTLMTGFYRLWAEGKAKAEALREAKLALMKKKANPFYWGAFILVGDPG